MDAGLRDEERARRIVRTILGTWRMSLGGRPTWEPPPPVAAVAPFFAWSPAEPPKVAAAGESF